MTLFTPNSVNQYASITTGSGRTAVGRAPEGWTIKVANVNLTSASRIGEIYWRDLTATNTSNPVWQSVVTRSTTPDPDVEKTNYFWYAKTPTVPTYDFDGNLTNDGRWEYKWDAENRLIQMETPSAVTNAPVSHPYTKLVFAYDWQGRRIARHVYKTTSTNLVSSRRWLYDGWNVIAEFSCAIAGAPTLEDPLVRLNTFTWGLDLSGTLQGAGGVGGLLVQTDVTPTAPLGIQRASYDGNGNIVAWTKSDAPAPTSRREYDAFGNTLVSEGATPCSFGFSTKMQDGETGLYYYGYRYYDPGHGRWPSRDPLREKGGINLYSVVKNNVIDKIDFLGLRASEDIKISACTTYIIGGHGLVLPRNHDRSITSEYSKKLVDGKVVDPVALERSELPNNVEATACGASAHVVGCSSEQVVKGKGDVTLTHGDNPEPPPNDWNVEMWKAVEEAKNNASKKCGQCCAKIAIIVKVLGKPGGAPDAFLNEDGSQNDEDRKKRYANWLYDCKTETLIRK